jgi:hypothetical protein
MNILLTPLLYKNPNKPIFGFRPPRETLRPDGDVAVAKLLQSFND